MNEDRAKAYWKKNVSIITGLLIIWAAVSLVAGIILANPLASLSFGKLPLSFWFAQQGSMVIFVIMIFYYCWRMDKLDAEYDVHEVSLKNVKITKDEGVSS